MDNDNIKNAIVDIISVVDDINTLGACKEQWNAVDRYEIMVEMFQTVTGYDLDKIILLSTGHENLIAYMESHSDTVTSYNQLADYVLNCINDPKPEPVELEMFYYVPKVACYKAIMNENGEVQVNWASEELMEDPRTGATLEDLRGNEYTSGWKLVN